MSTVPAGYYDPPCTITGDCEWKPNGRCRGCGKQLRCGCGQFVRLDGKDKHGEKKCPLYWAEQEEARRNFESTLP